MEDERDADAPAAPVRGPFRGRAARRWHAALLLLAGLLGGAAGVIYSAASNPQAEAPAAGAAAPPLPVYVMGLAFDGTPEPTPTPTPTPTPPPARLQSAEGVRIWSDGDSTSYFMTVALFQAWSALGGVPVRGADYKISSGLVRSDFFDWPAYLAAEMARYDPDVVVFMVGANDANQVRSEEAYAARVGAVMDLLYRPGRTVVWVGQPNMGRPDLAASVPRVNAIFRAQAAARPWVLYLDAWALTSGPDGSYTAVLPDEAGVPRVMRTDDGVHFTPAGGRLLALAVIAALFEPGR
ncbi:DUF459 domain-containing protein [Tepidiforma thermophila]|uniref:Uncharacterized protein DUF459 n=1 Tax=Tepidiforma thermophila (strain KCTC 52669 / CGMCC 1.13589 / G233) TaxID=2761530 RepID=A0A2A9HEI4_TEPT2|nr:DUF459 domain-containing protein [Tepidiforma thermophila]PFG73415.1 uncharacterized protein DUF459 [Tepidiforma thermophila]